MGAKRDFNFQSATASLNLLMALDTNPGNTPSSTARLVRQTFEKCIGLYESLSYDQRIAIKTHLGVLAAHADDPAVRSTAFEYFTPAKQEGFPINIETILPGLGDSHDGVRAAAVSALKGFLPERWVNVLYHSTQIASTDSAPHVRVAAFGVIAACFDQGNADGDALQTVHTCATATDLEEGVRIAAIHALGQALNRGLLVNSRFDSSLIERLACSDSSVPVRRQAARSIMETQERFELYNVDISLLAQRLTNESDPVANSYAEQTVKLWLDRSVVVQPLLDLLRPAVEAYCQKKNYSLPAVELLGRIAALSGHTVAIAISQQHLRAALRKTLARA